MQNDHEHRSSRHSFETSGEIGPAVVRYLPHILLIVQSSMIVTELSRNRADLWSQFDKNYCTTGQGWNIR